MFQKTKNLQIVATDFAASMILPIAVGVVTFGTVYAIQEGLKALFNTLKK